MASERSRYVSVNLLPHHKERLDHLVKVSGTNRNNFMRAIIMALSDEDVERLIGN
jgi:cytochrome c553